MKDYVLTIGIDKFYLSEQEANFYLSSIDKGAKYVKIGDLTLGTSFQSLVHKNALEGKYQCDTGEWHTKGAECYHNGEWKELPNGKMMFVENKLKKV